MTHNQVAYWDSIYRARNQAESNRIQETLGIKQNEIREFEALRNEYWTHKNYNWNESMFGYQLFRDLTGEMFKFAALGF